MLITVTQFKVYNQRDCGDWSNYIVRTKAAAFSCFKQRNICIYNHCTKPIRKIVLEAKQGWIYHALTAKDNTFSAHFQNVSPFLI